LNASASHDKCVITCNGHTRVLQRIASYKLLQLTIPDIASYGALDAAEGEDRFSGRAFSSAVEELSRQPSRAAGDYAYDQ